MDLEATRPAGREILKIFFDTRNGLFQNERRNAVHPGNLDSQVTMCLNHGLYFLQKENMTSESPIIQ
jgi:hypothetical protein